MNFKSLRVNIEQKILLPSFSLLKIITVKNETYLFVSSDNSAISELKLFLWTGTQFEVENRMQLKGKCKHLIAWKTEFFLFIAVNMVNQSILEIMKVEKSSDAKKIVTVQSLNQSFSVVKHFQINRDHYLISAVGNRIFIYWWNGIVFIEQQDILTVDREQIVDIASLGHSRFLVHIVVAKNNIVEYYMQAKSIHLTRLDVFKLPVDLNIKSIQIFNDQDEFFLLPIFKENYPPLLYEIIFSKSKEFSSTIKISSLKDCIANIESEIKLVKRNLEDIQNNIKGIWLKTNSSSPPDVAVLGSIHSKKSADIQEISFNQNKTNFKLLPILDFYKKVHSRVMSLKSNLSEVVMKGKYQLIKGTVNILSTMKTAALSVQNSLAHTVINGVYTSRLSSVLKQSGHQNFSAALIIKNGKFDAIHAHFINDMYISDFTLLKGMHQLHTGNFCFVELTFQNIKVASVNGLPSDSFILASAKQAIQDRKLFKTLFVDSLSTGGLINGLSVRGIYEKAVKIRNNTYKNLKIYGSLTILENLIVNYMSGKNLSHMILNSVKKNENEIIKGKKIFQKLVTAKDISVHGLINNFSFSNIFTLKGHQIISGLSVFRKVWFKDIDTDSLNDIDLSQEAVVKSSTSYVKNKVVFLQPVCAFEIAMKNSSTINSLDLSIEVLNIPKKNQVVFTNKFVLEDVIVSDNIEITESSIENILFHLEKNVLLKSKPQNVSTAFFEKLSAQNMQLVKINDILLDDLIPSNSDTEISSSKFFENVTVQFLQFVKGKIFSNLDALFLENRLPFEFNEMVIFGNLTATSFNNLLISNLMQVRMPQICHGEIIFDEISLAILNVKQLPFSKFNGANFSSYVSSTLKSQNLILNKTINHIKGFKMNIQGTLNGNYINKFYKTAVTLNTRQIITADKTFFNSSMIKALEMHNIFNMSFVAFCDASVQGISHKEFHGSFIVGDMRVKNEINDVNITDLNIHAFKTKSNNNVKEFVVFKMNLNLPEIRFSDDLYLDDVNFAELIDINEPLDLDFLVLSSLNATNVTVFGQVNHCGSIMDLFQYEETNELKIRSMKTFHELKIEGNLLINNSLNDILDDEISLILLQLNFDEDSERAYIFDNASIENLTVLDPINDINVTFILNDVVMQDKIQNLNGRKKFKTLNAMAIRSENLQVIWLNNINVSLLQNTYVSKTRKKQLLFLPKLPYLSARNLVLEKRLNGIRIPADVILSDKNEMIIFPVFMNSTIAVPDMKILGLVDRTNISDFIKSRTRLSSAKNILSVLQFMDDVTILGDVRIEGLMNNLNFSTFAKKFGLSVIQGTKTFETLSVSNIIVKKFMNNDSISNLSLRICKINESAILTELVHISQLKTISLIVDDINGIVIKKLRPSVLHVEKEIFGLLDNCSEFVDHHNRELNFIEDAIYYPSTVFTYFELHQSLNITAILKILPVYESGILGGTSDVFSLQLVMWIPRNETCRYYRSVVMDIHPNGTLEKNADFNGKLFPFTLGFSEENVKGFMLHSDRKDRCSENDYENTVKTVFFNGDYHSNVLTSPHTSLVADAKFIEMDIGVYLLVAYSLNRVGERLYLYEHDPVEDSWSVIQRFHFNIINTIDTLIADLDTHEIYLAVASDGNEPGIYLYEWDFENNLFEKKLFIPQQPLSTALWVNTGKDIFLLFAAEKSRIRKKQDWIDLYTEPVTVYIFDTDFGDLFVNQTINLHGIHKMEQFKLDGETFVLAVSRHYQIISVVQYRGTNGFELIQEIKSPGVVDATIYLTPNNELFLAVSSITGHSRVLRSVIRGGAYFV